MPKPLAGTLARHSLFARVLHNLQLARPAAYDCPPGQFCRVPNVLRAAEAAGLVDYQGRLTEEGQAWREADQIAEQKTAKALRDSHWIRPI